MTSIGSIKSWLFSPAPRPNRFAKTAAVGYYVKCAIHPSPISVINAVLMPGAEEIDKSNATDTADRRMVDKPVVRVARLVLECAGV